MVSSLVGHFNVEATSGSARAARLQTAHGEVKTPVFMPVGTKATVKSMLPEELEDLGAQIILGNTYHLHLRPGESVIKNLGGLHQFMNWKGPILTDSGGFQVFSLSQLRTLTEEGVEFRSHLDGSKVFMSPESSMQIQMDLGSDIIMAFDECLSHPSPKDEIRKSMDLTYRWLKRSKAAMTREQSLLFGIVQGGLDLELRLESLQQITSVDLPGYALGGFSVGEPIEMMHDLVKDIGPKMPANKPRYMMGVGTPLDLILGVDAGIDMFDCVMPTRNARHGMLYTAEGIINIKNKRWQNDFSPIDASSPAPTSRVHSKAYLRHLFISGEITGMQIASIHNLAFYLWLVKEARQRILDGSFLGWKEGMVKKLQVRL